MTTRLKHNKTNSCRLGLVAGRALLLLALASLPPVARASAGKSDPLCKPIREAVGAGLTLEQIMREFDTDQVHVLKCLRSKGRKRKAKRAQKAGHQTRAARPQAGPSSHGPSPAAVH